MKIIYCGFGRAGLECFYQLINTAKIEMSNIIVFTHDYKENKDFVNHLKNNKVTYYFDSVNNHYEDLVVFKPDLLLSIYYRYIVKPEVLELVNYKAMNMHPSYLPAYRGTKSSVWALINEEKFTGITFHYMSELVDDGRIILQKKMNILDTDNAFSLYNKLVTLFINNFSEAFNRLINDYIGDEQIGEASYYKRALPFGGERKFDETTFNEAKQFVKAMHFPPHNGAYFCFNDHEKVEINSLEELERFKDLFKEEK